MFSLGSSLQLFHQFSWSSISCLMIFNNLILLHWNYTLSSFMNHLELKRVRWRTARNVQYCGTCSGLVNPDKKPWTVLKHPKWALYQCKQFVYSVVFGLNLFVCTLDEVNHIFRCKKLSSSQNSLISGLNFTPRKFVIFVKIFETVNTALDPVNCFELIWLDLNLTLYSSKSTFCGQISRWHYP